MAKPRKNSPGTPLQPFPREKTRPTTAQSWPNREKTRPARPKTPKSSHFSRAGRTFSRFQRRTTEQGDFSPATTPLNTHHRDTTTQPPPQPVENSPCNTRHKAQPVQNSPSNTHLTARPVQNSPGTPKNNENWPFLASRENLFPFPTRRHRAGRIFSRNYTTQYPSQGHHHPTTTPTGTKLSLQHRRQHAQPGTRVNTRYKTLPALPPQSPTGTKLSPQHPPQGSTGTKLSRHAQKQRKLAISREQGESFPVPNATPPSRENFLPQQHHLGVSFNAADRLVPTFTRHQTNTSLSWALCGLLAAHHDAAPERAETGRRLADWKWPRHPQASSLHPTTRTNVSDVWPRHPQASFEPKLSTGTCAELEGHDQSAHS